MTGQTDRRTDGQAGRSTDERTEFNDQYRKRDRTFSTAEGVLLNGCRSLRRIACGIANNVLLAIITYLSWPVDRFAVLVIVTNNGRCSWHGCAMFTDRFIGAAAIFVCLQQTDYL